MAKDPGHGAYRTNALEKGPTLVYKLYITFCSGRTEEVFYRLEHERNDPDKVLSRMVRQWNTARENGGLWDLNNGTHVVGSQVEMISWVPAGELHD